MKASKESALREALSILKSEKKEMEEMIDEIVERVEEKEKEIIFVKKMLG